MIRWLLFLALAATLAGYTFWVYRRLELAVRGAGALAYLRAATLVVLLTLLFDPPIPWSGGGGGDRWTLLDVSASMMARPDGGTSAWERARARAAELEGTGWRVVTFGSSAGAFQRGVEPTATHTLLGPALERAAEAGARSVRVLTDTRVEDVVAVRAALAALPVSVEIEAFGTTVPNVGISSFDVRDTPRPDQPTAALVEVHAAGGVDSLDLDVYEEDRPVATVRIEAPSLGLRGRVEIELPPPAAPGRVRYTAVVRAEGDGFAGDDAAVAYAAVGHEEGALVLVSLRPDWEPRFLLPALEEVTGLPAVGFLRVGADRFALMGRAAERSPPVDSAAVADAVADAALLVVHGLDAGADAWMRGLVAAHGRALVWARDPEGAQMAGLQVRTPDRGEWYASSEIPASPLAGELAGLDLLGLPPLTDLMVSGGAAPGAVPLRLQLRGTGPAEGALHLGVDEGGRRAVVLAAGFWRWAAREGTAREAYRHLWSGVAGWLLADRGPAGPEVRPVRWVSEHDASVEWRLPGGVDGVHLTVSRGDTVLTDTVAQRAGALTTGPYAVGTYDFEADGPNEEPLGRGRFDVETRTLEMAHPPEPGLQATAGPAAPALGGPGRPLRASPWPYLLAIVLLCAEWIGRRRVGLR